MHSMHISCCCCYYYYWYKYYSYQKKKKKKIPHRLRSVAWELIPFTVL